jgi:hypothetical protein
MGVQPRVQLVVWREMIPTRFARDTRKPTFQGEVGHYPAGWNESARAMAQASRKRRSWVPSSNSPGRSDG